ncbi:MAG: tripartite tricarboxylate transporter substrate binding protein [Xanthobacteraceae bacterium]|nr:tripartite tricarboxylate transporter substrate binding protein [Xanthobacteraceae bacterium]
MRWCRSSLAAASVLLGLASHATQAQDYPSRPVTIVAPAAPGGVVDRLSRILAQRLSEAWGRQFVVEHKPGANNQLAAEYITKSAPDGYTLMVSPEVTFAVNPSLYKRLNYDPFKGFTPIAGLVIINHALLLHPSVQADSVKDLIEIARKKPGALNYGTFGAGSTGHLNMEMLQTMSGTKFTAVHYKGATPALTDVIGGHIQMMFVSVGTAVPQWQEKKVKFIAVGAAKRMELLPQMPTVAESGVPGYEAVSWFGLFGPPGMPADVVAKLNAEVRRIFADPELRKTMDREYFTPIVGTPEELTARIKADEPKWRKVIQNAGLTPQ